MKKVLSIIVLAVFALTLSFITLGMFIDFDWAYLLRILHMSPLSTVLLVVATIGGWFLTIGIFVADLNRKH